MESIKELLQYRIKIKPCKYRWQDEALEAIKFFADGSSNKNSIFRCFKQNCHRAKFAFNDCKELGKPYSKYFFKVFAELQKK